MRVHRLMNFAWKFLVAASIGEHLRGRGVYEMVIRRGYVDLARFLGSVVTGLMLLVARGLR